MPPVTVGYATSGGVQQLHRTGCLGDSMAFGLAVKGFGTKPLAKIATGTTPPAVPILPVPDAPFVVEEADASS